MVRFCTVLNNDSAIGLAGLLYSLRQRSKLDDIMVTVITSEDIDPQHVSLITGQGIRTEWIPAEELSAPDGMPKLGAWNLPYTETLVFIAADVVCRQSLAGIEQLEPTAVAPSLNAAAGLPCGAANTFNSSFFIFKPSADEFAAIKEFAASARTLLEDEVLSAYFVSQEVPALDSVWCLDILAEKRAPWIMGESKLLHFSHHKKPWKDPLPEHWQRRFWVEYRPMYADVARGAAHTAEPAVETETVSQTEPVVEPETTEAATNPEASPEDETGSPEDESAEISNVATEDPPPEIQ